MYKGQALQRGVLRHT